MMRFVKAMCLLLVPLAVQAAPSGLGTVRVSGYRGEMGEGLKLTFEELGREPLLARWTKEKAREVVAALEEEFQQEEEGGEDGAWWRSPIREW